MNLPTIHFVKKGPTIAMKAMIIVETPRVFKRSNKLQKTTPCMRYNVYEYLSRVLTTACALAGNETLSIVVNASNRIENMET